MDDGTRRISHRARVTMVSARCSTYMHVWVVLPKPVRLARRSLAARAGVDKVARRMISNDFGQEIGHAIWGGGGRRGEGRPPPTL